MKSQFKIILFIVLISTMHWSCKETIFGPNSGNITGTVKDNFGRALQSVSLSTVVLDSNAVSFSSTTDANGSFELLELPLGTIQISANYRGYQEVVQSVHIDQDNNDAEANFNLIGPPEIISLGISTDSIFRVNNDTLQFNISTLDRYKSENSSFDLKISAIVRDQDSRTVKIYDLDSANSQQNQLFTLTINALELAVGNYTISFVAFDEDNLESPTRTAVFVVS